MTDFPRDPKFPQRPSHPDFWILARIVADRDMQADLEQPLEEIAQSAGVDMEALLYVAGQRALRAAGPGATRTIKARYTAVWMDAFLAGSQFAKEKTDGKS
jgi:hypothetical protein